MNMALMGSLFFEFFKIGLFAVGGGPATLPFLMNLAQSKPWFTMEQLTNMVAISESTPGPIGLNMATYAGFQTLGLFGGLVSTLGLVIPSIVVIILIAKFLEGFNKNKFVQAAFKGIRPAVTALIAAAVVNLCRVSLFTEVEGTLTPVWQTIVLALIILGLMQIKKFPKFHPFFWFVIGAAAGIIFRF
ncbi:MAG: chromate transporter [Lachnospiraceae bacterium]|nr:chromate transporter [Lachnospiraceae bacterium]